MAYHLVARLDDLWSGEMVGICAAGRRILLVHVDGEVSAFEDRCAHLGVPMSDGCLAGGVIACKAHAWKYDARTGAGINPKTVSLRRFPVRIDAEGAIWVALDEVE